MQRVLFLFCAGNELFFVGLYLLKWNSAAWDTWTWPLILTCISAPLCFIKNFFNVVQLWKASKVLVGLDLAERAKSREEEARKKKAKAE